jgi:hypothetical protein
MNDEHPIKSITTTMTGDHFMEAIKMGNLNSIWKFKNTRNAIIHYYFFAGF